jgi:hypothetical protein
MSKPLTEKLSKEILSEVSFLLGRGKQTIICPLDQKEIDNAWKATFEPQLLAAFKTLKTAGYRTHSHKVGETTVVMLMDGAHYHVRFRQDLYDRPHKDRDAPDHFEKRWPLGADRWKEFVEWVSYASTIDGEFRNALWVVTKLLEMCKTVGQLTRALPELATFMPREIQETLREQRRASTMPYDWAAFPRDRVDLAQQALAKAYLLPDQARARRLWGDLNVTWASKPAPKT